MDSSRSIYRNLRAALALIPKSPLGRKKRRSRTSPVEYSTTHYRCPYIKPGEETVVDTRAPIYRLVDVRCTCRPGLLLLLQCNFACSQFQSRPICEIANSSSSTSNNYDHQHGVHHCVLVTESPRKAWARDFIKSKRFIFSQG